jgi:hypothetical protein
MYTIYQNSTDEGHNLESFQDEMIKICNNHREENRALAFAFILYDFENPQIRKVLNDTDYWQALNSISGNYLTVFSLNYRKEDNIDFSNYEFKGMQMLIEIPTIYNPSEGTNLLIERYFGNNINVRYPAVLFFQVDNNSVIDSLLIDLNERYIELAFEELKEYITSSVEALKKILPEYTRNNREIFDCLERNVETTRNLRKIKRVIRRGGSIIGLISSVKGLF